jgi:hypothetical protein
MIRAQAASGPPSPRRLGLRVGATPGPAALAGTQAGIDSDPDDRDSGSATCTGGPPGAQAAAAAVMPACTSSHPSTPQ